MPDETGAVLLSHILANRGHCPIHNVIYRLKLLVTSNLLGDLAFLRLKDNEVLKKIENMAGLEPQEALHRRLEWIIRMVGFRFVPPPFSIRIKAQPPPPPVEMSFNVVFVRVVEQDRAVAEFLFIRCDAENVRC